MLLKNAKFVHNLAVGNLSDGGAILASGKAVSLSIDMSSFDSNTADDVGGAIAAKFLSRISITGTSFVKNMAAEGGAIFAFVSPIRRMLGSL